MNYQCQLRRRKRGDLTWKCGACGRGALNAIPGVGEGCRCCGAWVSEVQTWDYWETASRVLVSLPSVRVVVDDKTWEKEAAVAEKMLDREIRARLRRRARVGTSGQG